MYSEVISANIEVHTKMIDVYQNEPHFRPENKQKVRGVLEALHSEKTKRLLDIGCGTGFIIDLARDLFEEIHGVDVTAAMLRKIDTTSGNITLHNMPAEKLPFTDNYFDMVTAYAFIHHVEDYRVILKEAFRVLKPGAQMYIDLEPNKLFWDLINQYNALPSENKEELSEIVLKEIQSVLFTDDLVEKEFNIEKSIFQKAEYTKSILGGIEPNEFTKDAKAIGFSHCEVSFQWFLGQGNVMHNESLENAIAVERYLNKLLPASGSYFKYLRFILTK